MMELGFKISGCFGDVLNSTPVLRYLSTSQNRKLSVETNRPEVFINNPYVEKIYDLNFYQQKSHFTIATDIILVKAKNKLEK